MEAAPVAWLLAEVPAQQRFAGLRRALAMSPEAVVAEVEAARLCGRGGAGFPTAVKWRTAAAGPAPRFVVVNGGEHEPGSFKDRLLMERHADRVVEGALIAAHAVGAAGLFFYVNRTFPQAAAALQQAVALARAEGLLGELAVRTVEAPSVYVAGEETAALEVIEGRPPQPRRKPPYPARAGLWGCPTVVNNVETLAQAAVVLRLGAERIRRVGTPDSPGTLLVSVTGWVNRPGVYEVPFGTPLREVIEGMAGGVWGGRPLKAVQPGGPSSAFLGPAALDTPLDPAALERAGSWLGCGAIRVVAQGVCMAEELLRIAGFFAGESCGQCGPCLQGTRRMEQLLQSLRLGIRGTGALDLLRRLGSRLPGKGICALVSGAAAPVASALALFPADFEHHARYGVCPQLGPLPRRGDRGRLWQPAGPGPGWRRLRRGRRGRP